MKNKFQNSRLLLYFFLLVAIILVFLSTETRYYTKQMEELNTGAEVGTALMDNKVYATVDGIGVEQFVKDLFFFKTHPLVFQHIILLVAFSFVLLRNDPLREQVLNPQKKELKDLIPYVLGGLILVAFDGLVMWLFKSKAGSILEFQLVNMVLLIILGLIFIKPKNFLRKPFFISFLLLAIGTTIYIELCSRILAGIHEGDWALVDLSGIAVYSLDTKHNLTSGYLLFRASNILLGMVSLFVLVGYRRIFELAKSEQEGSVASTVG